MCLTEASGARCQSKQAAGHAEVSIQAGAQIDAGTRAASPQLAATLAALHLGGAAHGGDDFDLFVVGHFVK